MSFFTKNSFLASVISDPRGGLLLDKDVYRRYGSTVRTSTIVGGNLDSRLKQIVFEIGRRFDRKAQCFANKPSTVLRVDASYPTNTILAEDFVGMAKKYTNFSAAFEQTSLAGVVERVATALAAQSIYGDISVTDIRGGNALDVNALGTYSGPVNSLSSTVFIPRLVNTVLTGDVFAVLASAVAGEGSSIATDIVELDATTRQPILSEVAGDSLGKACVDALRILGSNMTQCDQGPLFSLALVRGLHKVVSMVGHTDEGAVHRDLLRAGAYAPPFGGVHYGLDEYCGLPALSASGPVALAGYVDALVMSSAALVAHCDPGLEYGGRWYPTFYLGTGWSDNEVLPGVGQEGTTVIANRNRDSLLQDYHQFLEVYVPALAKLFGCTGSHQLAASVQSAMSHNLSCDNRHLKFASITPHFWIEPTSIINHDFVGSRCEDEGFASLGGRHSIREKPIFEDIVAAGPGNPNFSTYHVTMRSARTCWLLHHFNGHPKGGLGAVSVKQADPTTIIQSGAGTSDGMLLDKIMNSASISEFLWVRGQTPFCAPGELMSLTPTYGIQVRHCLFDMHGEVLEEFIPNNSEFLHSVVSVHVGLPIGLEPAKANHRASGAKRAKTRAAKELASVALRAARFGRPDMNEMANCLTAPAMRDPPRPTIDESTPYSGPTLAKADSVAIEGVDKKTERATGLAKRVVGIQGTTTVPVVTRPLANQPGGRGNAIPPPRRAEDDEIARPVAPAPPVHVSTVTPLDATTSPAAPGNGPTSS